MALTPLPFPPQWLRNRWGLNGGLALLYALLYGAWTFFRWGSPTLDPLITHSAFLPITAFTLVAAWRVYADTTLEPKIRRAWLIFSFAVFTQILGDVVAFYEDVILNLNLPYFSADVFYLSFYPLALAALLTLPSVKLDRSGWFKFVLDLLLMLISGWMGVWYFLIVPAVNIEQEVITPLIAAAYPISNFVVLGGVISLVARGRRQNTVVRSSLLILLAGLLFFVFANLVDTYFTVRGIATSGSWISASSMMAFIFFAFAAIRQRQPPSPSYADSVVLRLLDLLPLVLPFAAIGLGYSILIFVARTSLAVSEGDSRGVFAGAALLTVVVVARQIIELRENMRLNAELRAFSEQLEQRVTLRTQELQQSQEALLASEKLAIIGTLAAGVAHEISNPLSAIITASDHLEEELKNDQLDSETLDSYLSVISNSGKHALQIAQALRNQSRGHTPEHLPQPIGEVVREALVLMGGQIKRWHKVKLVTELAADLPLVKCDRNQIAQVIFNLLNNAHEAMPQGGTVTLRVSAVKGKVRMEVSDQGVGLSEEVKQNLFKPFYTTKPIGQGTGLGLSIVQAIVRDHDGTIEAQNNGAPPGATFVVSLPAA